MVRKFKTHCLHCGNKLNSRAKHCRRCRKPPVLIIDYRFELSRCLRRTAAELAFVAWDRETRQDVFMRVLLPTADAAHQARLSAEAHVLRQMLGLPGFPVMIEGRRLDQTGGLYLAEEYIDGKPLSKVLKKAGPGVVVDTLKRVCPPLSLLHEQELVHGSLCLDHMLERPNGEIVLVDFRQACRIGSDACGTGKLGYRAPEQWRSGIPVTPATDAFALGVCLYLALTRRFPYGTRQRKRLMRASYEPKPLSMCKRTLSSDIDGVVLQALHREPSRRFPNMLDMYTALAADFGTTTQIDGFGYRFPSIAARIATAIGWSAAGVADRLQAGFQVLWHALNRTLQIVRAKPKRIAAAALIVAGPAFVLAHYSIASPKLSKKEIASVYGGRMDGTTRDQTEGKAFSQDSRWPLEFMEPQIESDHAPKVRTGETGDVCRVQFLTWPPAYVYVGNTYMVEAPTPSASSVPSGWQKVRLVSKQNQQVEKWTMFSGGRTYVFKYNYDTNQFAVEERP